MIDQGIADELAQQPTRRDQYGRYKVRTPDGKLVGYTRATTVAKTLDDTSNLERWSGRMVATGLAARADLLALVHSTTDKRELNQIVDQAKEAGGASLRRNLGTALHGIIEQSYKPGYVPPAPYAADVEAVHDAIGAAGFTIVDGMAERIVVNDTHKIAGTFDLLVERNGVKYVADLKTGSSVKYGALGWAIQLAIYANADALYTQGRAEDGSEDLREPMPDVHQGKAVIIHVEPGSGRCDLYRLDIEIGLRGLELALAVREIRRERPLVAIG